MVSLSEIVIYDLDLFTIRELREWFDRHKEENMYSVVYYCNSHLDTHIIAQVGITRMKLN